MVLNNFSQMSAVSLKSLRQNFGLGFLNANSARAYSVCLTSRNHENKNDAAQIGFKSASGKFKVGPGSSVMKESRRFQGTNFATVNPSANIREWRDRDPKEVDWMTRKVLRPRLPESIVPPFARAEQLVEPWPYQTKGYMRRHMYLDDTLKRFDENTRLIIVEAPPGAGCTEFCRELAQRLDFHYIPQPKIEDILVDRYGIDKRDFYHLIPEKYCLFDEPMFFTAPNHPNAIVRAYFLFYLKCEAMCNAYAHLLNTGQGVILDRSLYTDIGFVRAMHEKKFVSDNFANFYFNKLRRKTLFEFEFFPHLSIYLDCPTSTCMENIKKRGRPWENNGKVIDYDYINVYKYETEQVLKTLSKEGEVLIFDWKTPNDMDSVLDEIYKIDFSYDWNLSDRYYKWNAFGPPMNWNKLRFRATNKHEFMLTFGECHLEVEELVPSPSDLDQLRFVMDKIVGKYCVGYNRSRGDTWREIFFPPNPRRTPGGAWIEYTLRDALFSQHYQHVVLYFLPPLFPDIPEEEFEPRRFDVSTLENWDHH